MKKVPAKNYVSAHSKSQACLFHHRKHKDAFSLKVESIIALVLALASPEMHNLLTRKDVKDRLLILSVLYCIVVYGSPLAP